MRRSTLRAHASTSRSAVGARLVQFVPLGRFSRSEAATLARYFGRRLGLDTSLQSSLPIPRSTFDRMRKQYVAEAVVDLLLARRAAGSQVVLIGLTREDMYIRGEPWRFAFSIRNPRGFALVSRARMDPRSLGLTPDPGLRMRRLQKMVAKNIGALVYGYRLSKNPRSAMFDTILSVDDLDFMTEEFRPSAASRARRSWLSRSSGICERGVGQLKKLIARSDINTSADLLAYAQESLRIQDERRSKLGAITPVREDKVAVRTMLARLGRALGADRVALRKLGSEQAFKSWLRENARFRFALKADALELGSRPCERYFDPTTYLR